MRALPAPPQTHTLPTHRLGLEQGQSRATPSSVSTFNSYNSTKGCANSLELHGRGNIWVWLCRLSSKMAPNMFHKPTEVAGLLHTLR